MYFPRFMADFERFETVFDDFGYHYNRFDSVFYFSVTATKP